MFEIVFEGVDRIERVLGVISEGLADLSAPVQAGLEVLGGSVLDTIVMGGRPAYPGLKDGSDRTPLFDSGALADAASATRGGVEGSLYGLSADGSGGQIGVDPLFEGARRHFYGFGTDVLGRSFEEPARAFFVMQPDDPDKVVEVFDHYLSMLLDVGSK